MSTTETLSEIEPGVRRRYSAAARRPEPSLCCPTSCNPELLRAIPDEILERDYGCGDPTPYLKAGETVLDLGSGAGKICFVASQVVGSTGRVVGIDMNDEMLALARRHAPEVARRVGYGNVLFRKGRIQDLALDLEELDRALRDSPVRSVEGLARLDEQMARLRAERRLVESGSIDVVVSSCVLNLVRSEDKRALFLEIHRVLRRGGRAVISDIVSDEDVPERLQRDPELWSGCISGAFREDRFLEAFEEAGFHAITLAERQAEPWRTIGGIEFRSATVVAYKGKEGPCIDQGHAVIYRGPFREVTDDDGHVLRRGVRTAVCEKTFRIYSSEPYRRDFDPIPPRVLAPLDECSPFPCGPGALRRDPRETKGGHRRATMEAGALTSTEPESLTPTERRPPSCVSHGDTRGSCC